MKNTYTLSDDLLFINLDDEDDFQIIEDDLEEDDVTDVGCMICGGDHYSFAHMM
jgi:hypothetical protein